MANKNSKKTMNERNHNPFGTYENKNKEAGNSHNQQPVSPSHEEFSAEFGSPPRNSKKRK